MNINNNKGRNLKINFSQKIEFLYLLKVLKI